MFVSNCMKLLMLEIDESLEAAVKKRITANEKKESYSAFNLLLQKNFFDLLTLPARS